MFKNCISFLLLCYTFFSFGQEDFKFWHVDSMLQWDDFKGFTTIKNAHDASTNCNIAYYFDIQNDTIFFEVNAYLDRNKSWRKKMKCDLDLLMHEQIHFDIAELYARLLRKELYEFPIPKNNITDTVKRIYRNHINAYKQEQEKFDRLSMNGHNKVAQNAYHANLARHMRQLAYYRKISYKRNLHQLNAK